MYARKTVCHVESKGRLGDDCSLRHIVAIFKASEYWRTSPCQQHTVVGFTRFRFSILRCLFPLTGRLVVFLFLASSTYNRIGHILRRQCLLKPVIEGKKGREDEEEEVSTY